MEAFPARRQQHTATDIVSRLRLRQHDVAGHIARVGIGRVAAAVGRVTLRHPAQAIKLRLRYHAPGARRLDRVAPRVEPTVRGQRRRRHRAGRRIDRERLALEHPPLLVVTHH